MYSSKRPHKFFYILTVIVFMAQLVMPTAAVRAQGEVPPVDPAASAPAPADASTPAAPADAATPAPSNTDAPPPPADPIVFDPAAPTMSADEAAAYIIPTPTPDVSNVGNNAVVVLDADGNPVPLATQAAADALVSGDPIWCPGNQNPAFDLTNCTSSYTSLTALLAATGGGDFKVWNQDTETWDLTSGTIWIESGIITEPASYVFINKFDNHTDLTLQGGWNKVSGTIGTPSTFTVPLAIFWGGNLTLNNITLSNPGTLAITGYDPYGMQVVVDGGEGSDKALNLNNVSVNRSTGKGARFTADGSVSMGGTKNQFNSNAGTGLTVDTVWAPISLNNITASYNTGEGAAIISTYGDISVGGASNFSNNTNSGVRILTNATWKDIANPGSYFYDYADITLNDFIANSNGGYGGFFQTGSNGYGNITLNGDNNVFSSNRGVSGLYANAFMGDIVLENLTVDNNLNNGATLATGGTGYWIPDAYGYWPTVGEYIPVGGQMTGGGSINISGDNSFSGNSNGYGLDAKIQGVWQPGDITGSNISADNNGQYGAYLWTAYGTHEHLSQTTPNWSPYYSDNYYGAGNVSVEGYNSFSDNGQLTTGSGFGLQIFADGDARVDSVTADTNGEFGADLSSNSGDVYVSDSNNYNFKGSFGGYGASSFSHNGWWGNSSGYGLVANAPGWGSNIDLFNISADDNNQFGARITANGTYGDAGIDGEYNSFSENDLYGLYVSADDDLWVYNTRADYNGSTAANYGADLNADYIYMDGDNTFNHNTTYGLNAYANQDLDIEGISLEADYNTTYGAYLYAENGYMDIYGSDSNSFSNNGWYGLQAYANDSLWGGNINAELNTQYGANLNADYINLDGYNNFSDNGQHGLNASAGGSVIIDGNSAVADNNDQYGAYLYSQYGSVEVFGDYNSFSDNGQYGLYAESAGYHCDWSNCDISLDNVTANDNILYGAQLQAQEEGSIYVSSSDFSWNYQEGLYARTGAYYGCNLDEGCNINLRNVTADGNHFYGAELYTYDGGDITVDGTYNSFSDNGYRNRNFGFGGYTSYSGLYAEAGYNWCDYGTCNITLDNVTASDNTDHGANLQSKYGGDLTITNSTFDSNDDAGLYGWMNSGDINLDNVTAFDNWDYGADLYTNSGDLTVKNSNFNYNSYDGLYAEIGGDITLDKVTAGYYDQKEDYSYGNGENGADLTSWGGNVSITNSNFNWNDYDGLLVDVEWGKFNRNRIETLPSIYMYNVTADSNGGDGFVFDGYPGGAYEGDSDPAGIVIECSRFTNNDSHGLDIYNEDGTITLAGVGTWNNNIGGDENYLYPDAFFATINCDPAEHGGKPYEYVDTVTTGSDQVFACDQFFGLHLLLPNGDFVAIPCTSRGNATGASVVAIPASSLPELPGGTVMSALSFSLDGTKHTGQALVSFKLADGENANGYSIMFWNGMHWEKVNGTFLSEGYFQAWVNQVGIYVLVKN